MLRRFINKGIEPSKDIGPQAKLLRHEGECNITGYKASYDQYHNLDHVGITNHLHSTQCDQQRKKSKADHDEVKVIAACQVIDGQCTEVEDGGQVYSDVQKQPEDGHDE